MKLVRLTNGMHIKPPDPKFCISKQTRPPKHLPKQCLRTIHCHKLDVIFWQSRNHKWNTSIQ